MSISRRALLAAGGSLPILATTRAGAAAHHPAEDLLPTAQECRRDNERMVDFGPRYTGSKSHNAYLDWLHESVERLGGHVLPYDHKPCNLWLARKTGLTVLDGAAAGPVRVASYYPRGGHTARDGVVGPLLYAGSIPTPSLSADVSDAAAAVTAIAAWRNQVAGWLKATIAGLGNRASGAVLLIDTDMPPPLTVGALAAIVGAFYIQAAPGAALEPWKRLWLVGLLPTVDFSKLHNAPAGIVYIVDGSARAAAGNYAPFDNGYVGTPALYVDRNEGSRLRNAAAAAPRVRFTVHAARRRTTSPSIVGILPGDGSTKKVLVLNTHSDGVNFAEENGGLGMIELARYFTGLRRRGRGLRHSLALSFVTGHFNGDPTFPQTQGFVDDHPDLVKRASAAMTIEHLGCAEWVDDEHGYHPTGRAEYGVMYCAPGLHDLARASLRRQPLDQVALARSDGNLYFGVGGALQTAGVPSLSYLTGPNYLVATGPQGDSGCLKQFDAQLQRKQIAWFADVIRRLDRIG
ncbi:MAG TPA: hypothetical protein VHC43_02260 [Mycobacteriales bacterium]|nr:hypothetical protein [Mycobacteriales bacterium]